MSFSRLTRFCHSLGQEMTFEQVHFFIQELSLTGYYRKGKKRVAFASDLCHNSKPKISYTATQECEKGMGYDGRFCQDVFAQHV